MGKCDEANVEVSMGDSASPMKPDNFTFDPPPEAPVFEPTPEEFEDPIAYINKIRPIAEKCGICKIKPPQSWQPPFAVDVDRLRFTPRIQRLNELEAITRVKLNFLDQILKFWELQGSALRIPTVDRKPLDLYTLHKIVHEAGGFDAVTNERLWSRLARRMGHPRGKAAGSMLKQHYERILYPYDVFRQPDTKIEVKTEKMRSSTPTEAIVSTENRRSPRENKWSPSGPEGACGARSRKLREHRLRAMTVSVPPVTTPPVHMPDPLAKYMCHVCGRGDIEEQMLLCDGCDDSYHTFCLLPPLHDIPKGDWRCPVCLAEEVSKPAEAFGFEQASREYTLHQFGEMADQFKSDYFNMPVHMVPTTAVEREFWRVVSSLDESVTVEYGADLHSMDHGSGFPTKATSQYPSDLEYASSPWNLNNLPLLPGSVLAHIHADISGMKIPWLYVGMCFAAFCWHNEDHWSYSINYLHWGEPKTWYGVPGSAAESLEAAMMAAAPELFQMQPDLLHQLVTIMNPTVLQSAGVPVFRTDQKAGEFVITFPRAYHAGFNQGYNFAEAVNFAPADWVRWGRACVTHYAALSRHCVFSHDELICQMSLQPERLTPSECRAALRDVRAMLRSERRNRRRLRTSGTVKAARHAPELLPDDERQCYRCRTACFLSSVTCTCAASTGNRVCLPHASELCSCPAANKTLRYRYNLEELPKLGVALKKRSTAAKEWASETRAALSPVTKRRDLPALKALLRRSDVLKLPICPLRHALARAVMHAEKCARVIRQLELHKMRTRTHNQYPKYRLTMNELRLFAREIDALACTLPEGSAVKEVVRQTSEFESLAGSLLSQELPSDPTPDTLRALEDVAETGARLCIRLPRLGAIQVRLAQAKWLRDARNIKDTKPLPAVVKRIIQTSHELTPHPEVDLARAELTEVIEMAEKWERKARLALSGGNSTISEAKSLLTATHEIPVALPLKSALQAATAAAKAWRTDFRRITRQEQYPSVLTMQALLARAASIPLVLPERDQFDDALKDVHEWKLAAEELFQPKIPLLEVLCPRSPDVERLKTMLQDEDVKPTDLIAAFKQAEVQELKIVKDIRSQNNRKDPQTDPTGTYCSCRSRPRGVMWQCDLCRAWSHRACVADTSTAERADGWRCDTCARSQRPRLDRLLALLVRLQSVPARVAEGEALQLATERAMAWQDRARHALSAHRARADHAYTAPHPAPTTPAPPPRALLHEGRLLEVSTDEENQLVMLVNTLQPSGPTTCVMPARRTHAGRTSAVGPKHRPRPAVVRGRGRGSGRGRGRGRPPSASSSSDDEDCAADSCLRPTGKEVDWVQCDGGCELWFHMHCVGLQKHKLRPDDDYLCAGCTTAAT